MDTTGLIYKNVLEDRYSKIRLDTVVKLLKPYIKDSLAVLDIGCYTADLLEILPPGMDYYGVDSDQQALKIAQDRGAKVFNLDLENQALPFESKKFDVIVATEVLEHLKDPEKLMLQIKNLLRPRGVVIVSLPNECTIYHRFKVLFGRGIDGTGFAPYYHLHFPTINQNNAFIAQHFAILKRHYWIHLGGGIAERIFSKIPYRWWMILAQLRPSLFARGAIYLCRMK